MVVNSHYHKVTHQKSFVCYNCLCRSIGRGTDKVIPHVAKIGSCLSSVLILFRVLNGYQLPTYQIRLVDIGFRVRHEKLLSIISVWVTNIRILTTVTAVREILWQPLKMSSLEDEWQSVERPRRKRTSVQPQVPNDANAFHKVKGKNAFGTEVYRYACDVCKDVVCGSWVDLKVNSYRSIVIHLLWIHMYIKLIITRVECSMIATKWAHMTVEKLPFAVLRIALSSGSNLSFGAVAASVWQEA